jgi:hypothetical protein
MIYLCLGGVPHIVGKLSMKATHFFYTSLQLEVLKKVMGLQSYKSLNFEILGVPRQNDIWM